jgi:hypothetical protein
MNCHTYEAVRRASLMGRGRLVLTEGITIMPSKRRLFLAADLKVVVGAHGRHEWKENGREIFAEETSL